MLNIENLLKVAEILGGIPVLGMIKHDKDSPDSVVFGDIILRVNDVAITGITDFNEAKKLDSKTLKLGILRRDKMITVEMDISEEDEN